MRDPKGSVSVASTAIESTRAFVFVPVRMASTRLPEKPLRHIAGKPVLQHLLERVRLSVRCVDVVLCTTTNPADEVLVDLAKRVGVRWYRGSEEDLLERFRRAAEGVGANLIVNVDGDDLLVDPEQVDEAVAHLERTGADFLTFRGLPFGAAPVGVKVAALETVCRMKTETDTATGWGRFFEQVDGFRIEHVEVQDPALRHPELRLTLDYPEDFRVFEAIYAALYQSAPLRLRDIVHFLEQHPEVAAINANLTQRYWTHFEAHSPGSRKRQGTDRA